ncbi:subtilase family protein [Tumebacillus sp. BK434]|uniref:S8 family serine peptidase n=1 Tax=Tumebacillus sp. BK434 TaxID=2512169 RepID=UPI001053A75A|nr:S8 family serine peptidase [Tumebacillus sp. BK434]TCP59096.1 subtilase family protein [Tumebacillus sp. BK434]
MKKSSALMLALALGMTTVTGLTVDGGQAQAQAGEQKFLVVFKQDSGLPAGYESVIANAGGSVKKAIPKLGAVQVTSTNPDFKSNIEKSNLVMNAGIENTIYPETVEGESFEMLSGTDAVDTGKADLYNRYGWDIKQVTNDGAAWNLPGGTGKSVDGKDIVIAVVDTGIDYTHPDLKKNYLYGKSFVPGVTDPRDDAGHGTHVAGSIAGVGRIMGVGPDLKVAAYRVFGPTGGAQTSDIANALMTAADDNVDVVNMSLGGYDWLQDPEYATKDVVADVRLFNRAIQYAIKGGVTVVGSAGNNNFDLSSPGKLSKELGYNGATHRSPSSQTLIRVAANGFELNRTYYSNYGVGKIDVTAPGGDYGTAWLETRDPALRNGNLRALSTVPGGYAWYMGTSMAAPKTAALAGLIIAKHGKDKLSPQQVKSIIQRTAIDINKPGYDGESGFGLINAVNALK